MLPPPRTEQLLVPGSQKLWGSYNYYVPEVELPVRPGVLILQMRTVFEDKYTRKGSSHPGLSGPRTSPERMPLGYLPGWRYGSPQDTVELDVSQLSHEDCSVRGRYKSLSI